MASPYSVIALDKGDKAEISWTAPIENIIATKSEDSVAGNFGGAYNMLVGHRYTSDEIQSLDVDGEYYVQSISFVPTACSRFTISVWQGEEGNESLVYQEEVEPMTYGDWNECRCAHRITPYRFRLRAGGGWWRLSVQSRHEHVDYRA